MKSNLSRYELPSFKNNTESITENYRLYSNHSPSLSPSPFKVKNNDDVLLRISSSNNELLLVNKRDYVNFKDHNLLRKSRKKYINQSQNRSQSLLDSLCVSSNSPNGEMYSKSKL